MRIKDSYHLLEYDEQLRIDLGCDYLIGVDEVGRGPLSGPIVAAAVIMLPSAAELPIKDSKKVSPKLREELKIEMMKEHVLSVSIAQADADVIDQIGIMEANRWVMADALSSIKIQQNSAVLAILDGAELWGGPAIHPSALGGSIQCEWVYSGDALSLATASASIIAKVTRDNMLIEMGRQYPEYGFERHKGYGTQEHINAIHDYGIIEGFHRKSFLTNILGGDI